MTHNPAPLDPLADIDLADLEPTPDMMATAVTHHLRLARFSGRKHHAAQAMFERWKALAPAHFVAAVEVEALMAAAKPAAEALARADRWRAPAPRMRLRAFTRPMALAASLALICLLGWTQRDAMTRWTSDAAAYAEQREIGLGDGSHILLNARSALDYRLLPNRRTVAMKMGEAFFSVAHDPMRPFIIETPGARIRVVGTQFNVRLEHGQTIVTVDRGIVRVSPEDAPGNAIMLTAGQQAFVDGAAVQRQPQYDRQATSAWRRGRMIFYEAPLADVVAELNRYRSAPIFILGDHLRQRPISGLFRTGNTDGAVETIERTLRVSVTRLPGGFIILS